MAASCMGHGRRVFSVILLVYGMFSATRLKGNHCHNERTGFCNIQISLRPVNIPYMAVYTLYHTVKDSWDHYMDTGMGILIAI